VTLTLFVKQILSARSLLCQLDNGIIFMLAATLFDCCLTDFLFQVGSGTEKANLEQLLQTGCHSCCQTSSVKALRDLKALTIMCRKFCIGRRAYKTVDNYRYSVILRIVY